MFLHASDGRVTYGAGMPTLTITPYHCYTIMAPIRNNNRRDMRLSTTRRLTRQQQAIWLIIVTTVSLWYRDRIRRHLGDIRDCISMLHVPTGRGTAGREYGRGSVWVRSMLAGHPERIYDITRLRKEQFLELLDWLQDRGLQNSKRCTAPEKLVIFLGWPRGG